MTIHCYCCQLPKPSAYLLKDHAATPQKIIRLCAECLLKITYFGGP